MTRIALAALSARVLAEAAARERLDAVALDLFGDQDTCRAAATWLPIGAPETMRIDPTALLDALASLARRGDVQGWVAGAGFEGQPELLEAGAKELRLFGTAGADQRRVRDPAAFFDFLQARGFHFPAVRPLQSDDSHGGWLTKDAGGCGGWHITHATPAPPATAPGESNRLYQQREARGVPMSATFIANGREAVVLGFNEQIVAPLGTRPYVYRGVLGPVPLDRDIAAEVKAVVCACTEQFGLRGLGSLDFLLDARRVLVLEINPRPPASLALYPRVDGGGPLRAHLQACIDGRLPRPVADDACFDQIAALAGAAGNAVDNTAAAPPVCGNEIIYAPQALDCCAATTQQLARRSGTHDLPRAGTRFAAGEPVCSVSACGPDAATVKAALARRRDAVLRFLDDPRLSVADEPPPCTLELAS